jgi:hypothetical protein
LNELGDNKIEKKMVTISTTEDREKSSNCVTPKKKAANNTAAASSSVEATTEQTAPNILVYKKVGLENFSFRKKSFQSNF